SISFSLVLVHRDRRTPGCPHIDEDKEEQPDSVNEVPVPGSAFEAEMLLRREVTGHGAEQTDEQEDGTDEHVEAVEAGRHVERRAEDGAREIIWRMHIFVDLHVGEQHAKCDRDGETPDQATTVILQQSMVRPGERRAGKQKDDRVVERQVERIDDLDPLGRPLTTGELAAAHLYGIRRE